MYIRNNWDGEGEEIGGKVLEDRSHLLVQGRHDGEEGVRVGGLQRERGARRGKEDPEGRRLETQGFVVANGILLGVMFGVDGSDDSDDGHGPVNSLCDLG